MMTRFCIVFVLLSLAAQSAAAQDRVVPSEVVSLVTKDGVQLTLNYFRSSVRQGSPEAKQVTPVVLLHDHKETRAIYNSLAQRLQSPGGEGGGVSFAAVTVDLRGHGGSTKQVYPSGETIDLDAAKLRRDDFLSMVGMDLDAVRSFLVDRNDAGELNLNKLCVIGAGMGANVAANWALQDWSWPPLAVGKQGQDVKALVLISPQWSFNGLSFQAPLRFRPLKANVAWLIVFGAESPKSAADARRIFSQLERFHPEPASTAGVQGTSTLQEIAWKSKLQGSTLLRQVGAPIEESIVAFLTEHVAKKQLPWSNRRERLP